MFCIDTRPSVAIGAVGVARRAMDEVQCVEMGVHCVKLLLLTWCFSCDVGSGICQGAQNHGHIYHESPGYYTQCIESCVSAGLHHSPFCPQAVSFMLADMATGIEAARLLVYKSSFEIDQVI